MRLCYGFVRCYHWEKLGKEYMELGASLMAQMVKHLPALRATWVHSLAREDPLEKEMATHSSTLAWRV